MEFTISQNARDIAETILADDPKIVGFGVYIWNTRQTLEVVSILKRVKPELRIVLGGPEVSYENESEAICRLADLTIKGEADERWTKKKVDISELVTLRNQGLKWREITARLGVCKTTANRALKLQLRARKD